MNFENRSTFAEVVGKNQVTCVGLCSAVDHSHYRYIKISSRLPDLRRLRSPVNEVLKHPIVYTEYNNITGCYTDYMSTSVVSWTQQHTDLWIDVTRDDVTLKISVPLLVYSPST